MKTSLKIGFNNDYILYNVNLRRLQVVFDDKKIISVMFIKGEYLELISTNADNDFLNQLVFSIIKEYSILND